MPVGDGLSLLLSPVGALQVQNAALANASGVLVYALPGRPLQDMNCAEDECNTTLKIPAAMVHVEPAVVRALR